MTESVFSYSGYKNYLNAICGPRGTRRGQRSLLAKAVRCDVSYITQVLNGDRHFTLEQGERASIFLKHSANEQHYFLLLLSRDRAGSVSLQKYYQQQIDTVLEKRLNASRLGTTHQLTEVQQSTYYSSWIYAAVDIALSLSSARDLEFLADRLDISMMKLKEVIEFLQTAGFVKEEKGKYVSGPAHIHLENNSPLIPRHHTNWRLRAIRAVESLDSQNIHYSAVVSLSKRDTDRIKEILIEAIDRSASLVAQSPEEEMYALCLDWFRVV